MPKKDTQLDYQQLSHELSTILLELQQNDLDVDKAVQHYERGLDLVKQLENYLTTAENKITKLTLQNSQATDKS